MADPVEGRKEAADRLHSSPQHWIRMLIRGSFGRVGIVLVIFVFALALVGPLLAPYSPTELVGTPLEPLSGRHWLGTDHLGRDVASRVLNGGRSVILLSGASVLVAFVVGAILGVVARYRGGPVDELVARGSEVLMSLPPLLVIMVLISSLGHSPVALVAVVAAVSVPSITRTMRYVTSQILAQDYVTAARLRGESTRSILWREVVPNITGPALAEFSYRFSYTVIFISALSFLGLGVQPPSSDWGVMLSDGRLFISRAPQLLLVPAVAIALLTVGLNLVAEQVSAHLAREVQPNVEV